MRWLFRLVLRLSGRKPLLHSRLLFFYRICFGPPKRGPSAASYTVAAVVAWSVGSRNQVVRVPLPLTSMGPRRVVAKSSLTSR